MNGLKSVSEIVLTSLASQSKMDTFDFYFIDDSKEKLENAIKGNPITQRNQIVYFSMRLPESEARSFMNCFETEQFQIELNVIDNSDMPYIITLEPVVLDIYGNMEAKGGMVDFRSIKLLLQREMKMNTISLG